MFNDSGGLRGLFEGADSGQLVFFKKNPNLVEGNETSVCQVSVPKSLILYADQTICPYQTDYRVPEKVL